MERAFGLLVGRWGIFWKRLLCHQSRYRLVIRAAVRLHNIAQSYACEWTAQDEMGARQRAAMHGAAQAAGEPEDLGTELDPSASDEVCGRNREEWRRQRETHGRSSHHAAPVPARTRRQALSAALARSGLQRPAPRLAGD